jgi:hypothetical protein
VSITGQIIRQVNANLPDFNRTLLIDYREKEVSNTEIFVETVFKEALKLFNGQIKYLGYRICSLEERLADELNTKNIVTNGKNNIRVTEIKLAEYRFEFEEEVYSVKLHIPYLYKGRMIINNTDYAIQLSVAEKVFAIIKDGIVARVIRSPIRSNKNIVIVAESTTGNRYYDSVITIKIYYNKRKNRPKAFPTIIHYLLCRYGLVDTLGLFNISKNDVSVVNVIDEDDLDTFEYFPCSKVKKGGTPLYLKVDKKIMTIDNILQRRVVISLLYLLQVFNQHTIEDLYDPDATIYKILLGKLTHGPNTKNASALDYMNDHISSLETYLDPVTKQRLAAMGIYVNNIYDLLIFIFKNMSSHLMENKRNDLYNRRIDIVDDLFLKTIVKTIYLKFYNYERKPLSQKSIKTMLKIPRDIILKISQKQSVIMSPSTYNPNELLSYLIKKIRASGTGTNNKQGTGLIRSKEQLLHPSTGYVESLLSYGNNNPGSSGHINPFLEINPEDGFVVKAEFTKEFEKIRPYLPYK